ncbi:MAG: hypothetical protein GY834_11215, partial [Bacteroidetes bacterium]|nr:hypothetical protein [Bacteroidota bacterium]
MKKVYTLLVALLLTATLWAQSPEKINYQAVIRDANSTLLTNQAVGMQISILQGSASGTAVYVETQSPTTNANGLVTVEIGNGTSSDDFSAIDWSVDSYFIKTETDPTGGSDYTITGTSQLLSIPYALYAKIAENYNETDPLFSASPFIALTQEDVDNWAGELDELDPVFLASFANTISEADTTYWNNKLDEFTELDSVFLLSLANAISETDTTYWNSKLDEFTETDPIFLAHPSSSITEDNIEEWKDVWTRYTDN